MQRSIYGSPVAVFRRGKLTRVETRFNDRLAIALLSGRESSIGAYRRTAVSRRAYRQDLRDYDERGICKYGSTPEPILPRLEPSSEQLAEEARIRERLKELEQPRRHEPRIRFL